MRKTRSSLRGVLVVVAIFILGGAVLGGLFLAARLLSARPAPPQAPPTTR
jgi:hypothetical protein